MKARETVRAASRGKRDLFQPPIIQLVLPAEAAG
jgi:hypothetical protein